MCHLVCLTTGILAARLCQFDALPLAFTAILEIVPSHLQGELQQHSLERFDYNLRNAVSTRRDVGKFHNTGHGKACALIPNCLDQLFSLGQRQTTDAVDLFRDYDFAGLKIRYQTQQLRPIGASVAWLSA
ncbi:hypothetical protein EV132_1262 [Rhizobium sullae]|uniref:Uncharacterized protein n=1 Tax=Rhizobium sullae TaxID=50338 RepID=A0A4R3PS61_RHISU|nr:hypothetical protein EV132_1262 [Rhizobium sullae]